MFRNELTACLALVVPVGMSEEARREWLAVAWETLRYLPRDLLVMGCRKARETADHPSKIVPAIIAETRELMDRRRDAGRSQPMTSLPPPPPADICTPDQAKVIIAEFGLASRYPSNRA